MSPIVDRSLTITTHRGLPTPEHRRRWKLLSRDLGESSPSRRLEWLDILHAGLGHESLILEACYGDESIGMLPLVLVRSALFGKFLVGLPYLNVGGALSARRDAVILLIDRAVELANELEVKHLELRHEERIEHASFNHEMNEKVHMRRDLPLAADDLWHGVGPKVRNQVRKAEKEGLAVEWGRDELLSDFYAVFCRNMRDLGTPVFSRRLFDAMLTQLKDAAEIAVVRYRRQPVAVAILTHGDGMSEVPSASSLRPLNHLNGNMLLYWHLLQRSIDRGQQVFDFGRSSAGSSTFRFKSQWGATPHVANWQYYVRNGSVSEMRPTHPKNQRRIAIWKRLPVWATRILGPPIVRGIP